ncbi:IclR family transcriptional regulator [Puteibacter caeruleilacunae]|nr:IclR family transcriptional regulator [Puteibacter caeruleilacunae]
MSTKEAQTTYHVPNLERALMIFEYLAEHPNGCTQTDLVNQLGVSKNSIFRITQTLLGYGYLEKEDDSRLLRLSKKFIMLGNATLTEKYLTQIALEELKVLRNETGETALVCTFINDKGIVLEQALGTHTFKFVIDPGTECPLYCSAPGKAYLAQLGETELDETLKRIKFEKHTPTTIVDVEQLKKELSGIQDVGYSIDRSELLEGVHCVGAAIVNKLNHPIGAIWITGPLNRLRKEQFEKYGELVKKHAHIISQQLRSKI